MTSSTKPTQPTAKGRPLPDGAPRLPPFPPPWVELQRDEGPDHQTLVGVLEPPQGTALLRTRTVTRTGVSEAVVAIDYACSRWVVKALRGDL